MTAATLTADLSSSALTFVLPLETDRSPRPPTAPADAVRLYRRGQSAAVRAASKATAGILAFAPPPGALGYRTLWVGLWVLFGARLLWSLLSSLW